MRKTLLAASIAASLLLTACGGNSTSGSGTPAAPVTTTSLSGTAAAGAPLVGTVTVKDSLGATRQVQIEADGGYTIDVSGMTGPFVLQANGTVGGRSYRVHSAATEADIGNTINVTPLTDLIVANMAGEIAANYFDRGDFAGLSTAELDSQAELLRQRLGAILTGVGLDASIDLLRASFSADHTGLDAALDLLRVEVDPATAIATITSIIDGQQITDDLAAADTSALTVLGDVSAGVDALTAITATLETLTGLLATSLPAADNPTLTGLFTSGFLHSGQDLNAFLSELTTDSDAIGLRFDTVSLVALDTTAGTAEIVVNLGDGSGWVDPFPDHFQMLRDDATGIWKLHGDRSIVDLEVIVLAEKQTTVYVSTATVTDANRSGFEFWIEDDHADGIDIDRAIVTGPGLPAGGILLTGSVGEPLQVTNDDPSFAGHCTDPSGTRCFLDDADIAQIAANDEYTIELYATSVSTDTPRATYTRRILAAPYLTTALPEFPAITSPTTGDLPGLLAGGNIAMTWTMPAGMRTDEVTFAWLDSNDDYMRVDEGFWGADSPTSATLAVPAPTASLRYGWNYVFAKDGMNRDFLRSHTIVFP